jgi:hypothetical protein
MLSTPNTPACPYIIKQGTKGDSKTHGELRCLAEADESGFCPVHAPSRQETVPLAPPARAAPDLDVDVLPWNKDDCAIFTRQPAARRRQRR